MARYFLIFSVLFVTACSSTQDQPLSSSVPASEREAITGSAQAGENGSGIETIGVFGEDLAADAVATQDYLEARIGDRVQFGYDSYTLTSEARQTLLKQAKWLQRFSDLEISVEGHCDERGTREYNLALGARRANAAQEYLISKGVPAQRLRVISYGKERPIEVCSNEACYAKNRRAVTVLAGGLTS